MRTIVDTSTLLPVYAFKNNQQNMWTYLLQGEFHHITTHGGAIDMQGCEIMEDIIARVGREDILLGGPQINTAAGGELQGAYPDSWFVKLTSPESNTMYRRALKQETLQNTPTNIKYVASDASAKTGEDISSWAWVSAGAEGSYSQGVLETGNVDAAELYGLLHSIIAHADTPEDLLHVMSDSKRSVEWVNERLRTGEGHETLTTRGYYDLGMEAYDVLQSRDVTVQWVRGHRSHRMNITADGISRLARLGRTAGEHRTKEYLLHPSNCQGAMDLTYMLYNPTADRCMQLDR